MAESRVSKMESRVEGRLRRSRSLRGKSKPETQSKPPAQKDEAGLRERTFDSRDNDDARDVGEQGPASFAASLLNPGACLPLYRATTISTTSLAIRAAVYQEVRVVLSTIVFDCLTAISRRREGLVAF
jgi:hypothetical protein